MVLGRWFHGMQSTWRTMGWEECGGTQESLGIVIVRTIVESVSGEWAIILWLAIVISLLLQGRITSEVLLPLPRWIRLHDTWHLVGIVADVRIPLETLEVTYLPQTQQDNGTEGIHVSGIQNVTRGSMMCRLCCKNEQVFERRPHVLGRGAVFQSRRKHENWTFSLCLHK